MNTLEEFLDKILIVLVIYRQTLSSSAAWKSLYPVLRSHPHSPAVLIYDNSPQEQVIDPTLVTYHHDPGNPGVSKAYNFAAELARGFACDWIILFDQDTEINRGTLESYYNALTAYPEEILFAPALQDKHGILSPFIFQFGGGRRLRLPPRGLVSINHYKVINSGLMVRLHAFRSVGGYDENFPLDFSDIVFINRMRKVTSSIIITEDQLTHSFSGSQPQTASESLTRFTIFVRAAFRFANGHGSASMILIRTFFRALRLSIRHRDSRFISVHYSAWRS